MKRTALIVTIIYMLTGFACCQEKTPTITTTEHIALYAVSQRNDQLQQQFAQLNQEFNAIRVDVAKNHPGFHLDPTNPFSGKLVADAAPKK